MGHRGLTPGRRPAVVFPKNSPRRRRAPSPPPQRRSPRTDSDARALTVLVPGGRVRAPTRVARLRRRDVPRAIHAPVDRVGLDFVAVRVDDGVAEEALPEPVVARDVDRAVDDAVLDRVPGNVERRSEGSGATDEGHAP